MFAKIVSVVATWVAAIVIVVFLIFLVKSIIEMFKGQGSVFKIIGQVIAIFFFIGVIYTAVNYDKIGQSFSNVTDSAIENIGEEAGDLFE